MTSPSKYWHLSRCPNGIIRLEWDKLAGRKCAKRTCPENAAHNGSGKRLGDLHQVLKGTPLHDFLWTWQSECVVQDKVLRQLTAEGFTGFLPRPVHIRWEEPSDQPLPRLWELEITGWGGMAPLESGIKRTARCAACGQQTYTGFTSPAFLVDEKQWDGSDFFMIWPMPRYIIVTERVASFIRSNGFSGVALRNLDQLPLGKGFGPGGLRLWMADDRARRLSEGIDVY